MSIEFTILDPIEATTFDTPELIAARKACNTEIAAILAERERIDADLQAVKSIPVEDLTVDQMSAGRLAKEATFRLLQRELKLRNTLLAEYIESELATAQKAHDQVNGSLAAIEASIVADLEKIGYQPFAEHNQVAGQWNRGMINNHPRFLEAKARNAHLLGRATNYEIQRTNRTCCESIQAALTSVRNALVG